jgi:hypothetical protein
MKMLAKTLTGLLFVGFMVTAYSVGTVAAPAEESFSGYIEVCSQGTVYLPPGTRYVTCHGKVMRVVGIVRLTDAQKAAPGNCYCPECCGGFCAVIVSCGGAAETATSTAASPDDTDLHEDTGDLCTVYLACGD